MRRSAPAGVAITMISAGGGLPVPYRSGESYVDIDVYFSLWDKTRKRLETAFGHPVHLEIEPGRYLVAESGYLVSEIRAIKQMGDNNLVLNTRIRDLERQLTKTRDEAVNNKLNLDSLKERFQNMLAQNEDLQRENNQLRNPGSRAGTVTPKGPPPEQVRGTVKAVDGNLATVSVGSDSGVTKDHTLYIFRLTPSPEYLGKLTVLSATPFEAVGRVELAQRRATIKPGDEVASRIAGLK
jgi:hypothetical protein